MALVVVAVGGLGLAAGSRLRARRAGGAAG